jgi:bifunctional N-acetylglucosamine-1-phosphate-uridyltransferase/glucosamine-1-phosphate-acetyltransferase GlmU-like protein
MITANSTAQCHRTVSRRADRRSAVPVEVGAGAYTGAGAVIRQDVPPDALAVSKGDQRNMDDYVKRIEDRETEEDQPS